VYNQHSCDVETTKSKKSFLYNTIDAFRLQTNSPWSASERQVSKRVLELSPVTPAVTVFTFLYSVPGSAIERAFQRYNAGAVAAAAAAAAAINRKLSAACPMNNRSLLARRTVSTVARSAWHTGVKVHFYRSAIFSSNNSAATHGTVTLSLVHA